MEAVRGVSFTLDRERLAIVGESGSGKTMTGRSILRLIRPPGRIAAKRMTFDGVDLIAASEAEMRAMRGQRIAMVMQDPKYSLNPLSFRSVEARSASASSAAKQSIRFNFPR